MQQHQAHLQEDLQLLGDAVGFAVGEGLRAVTALQQEGLAALRGGQPRAQGLDLPGHHDGRQARDLGDDALERRGIGIDGLLLGRAALPARRVPGDGFR